MRVGVAEAIGKVDHQRTYVPAVSFDGAGNLSEVADIKNREADPVR